MDSWEWNKIAAAILGVLVFIFTVHFAADAVFTVPRADPPGYAPVSQEIPPDLKPIGAH